MKQLLYLDTDIWLYYILYKRSGNSINSDKKTLKIDQLDVNKVDIYLSEINLIEISEKLADEKRMKDEFRRGLSILNIRMRELEKKELKEIDLAEIDKEIKSSIIQLPLIVSDKTPTIDSKSLSKLTEISIKYSIYFLDALHFYIADVIGCNYFLSGDSDLCRRLTKLKTDVNSSSIEISYVKNFIGNHYKHLSL